MCVNNGERGQRGCLVVLLWTEDAEEEVNMKMPVAAHCCPLLVTKSYSVKAASM